MNSTSRGFNGELQEPILDMLTSLNTSLNTSTNTRAILL